VTSSLSLGRIAGIRIGVHWSWLLVLGLLIWTLSESVFPRENPGLSESDYRTMAVVAAVLLFVSVLLHELGHALQARREGLEIEGITLWLLGGVASFRGDFPGPGAELRIAGAGPVVTLALSGAFAGVAAAAELREAAEGVAWWLGYINFSLLVFNLLPALPLDGGRILRAALWRFRHDFVWATKIAAEAGRATGLLLIAGGLVLFLMGGTLGGAWLAFIGWFVLSAAGGEAQAAQARQAIAGLRVRDVMVRDPRTARPDETLATFLAGLDEDERLTAYPVVDEGRLVGLLPIRTATDAAPRERERVRVEERMRGLEGAPRLAPDDDLYGALSRLAEAGVNRGLVLEGDRLVGHMSFDDAARTIERVNERRL
jgi:Zn-dependent protease/CBS domain-containing protein